MDFVSLLNYVIEALPFIFLFGISFGQSSGSAQQSAKSNTGVTEEFKGPLSETAFKSITEFLPQLKERFQGGFRIPDTFKEDVTRPIDTAPFTQRGRFGLSPGFDTAATQLGKQLFASTSASAAQRGQLSPHNLPSVVGGAVRQAAPMLADFAERSRNLALFGPEQQRLLTTQRVTQSLAPFISEEEATSGRIAEIRDAIGLIAGLLGGTSVSQGTSGQRSFNFGLLS